MSKLDINKIMIGINIDELKDYYSNHSTNSTYKKFNLTKTKLDLIFDYYGIEKHDKATNIALTNIEKYGHPNVFQTESVKNKSKATKKELYGSEGYNNSAKRRETCLEVFGTPSASGNSEIKEKVKSTFRQHYNKDNIFQDIKYMNNKYIEKYGSLDNFYDHRTDCIKASVKSKYNVDNVSQLADWAEKVNSTSLENNGCLWPCQSEPCKTAYRQRSKLNIYFENLLVENNIVIDQPEFAIDNYSYDFKIGNILLEINPSITHNSTYNPWSSPKDKNYHVNKSKVASENGYRCIHVWDWDDINKVLNLLKPRQKLYARDCAVKLVDEEMSRNYINLHHLQNYIKDDIRLGLFYNNELVSIMTFGRPRYNKNYEYELLRFCASHYVIGGAEKLFKYFIAQYNPKSVISYCDTSKFSGKMYQNLGFVLKSVSAGIHWYNIKTKQHITDNLLRQRGFDQLFGTSYGKGTSNEELMLNTGFVKIYDAGQATYLYLNNKI